MRSSAPSFNKCTIGSANFEDTGKLCRTVVKYEPSPWETYWSDNIDTLRAYDKYWASGCEQLLKESVKVETWLKYWTERSKILQSGGPDVGKKLKGLSWDDDVFSRFIYSDSCTGVKLATIPIEPLVGFLRHPLALCSGKIGTAEYTSDPFRLSKDYLIVPHIDELPVTDYPRNGRASFFFDLGASIYSSGAGGASQSWFTEMYESLGFNFERIIAWDPKPYPPEKIFNDVPERFLPKLSYFNVGITKVGTKHDPLRFITELTKQADTVILKVDIDHVQLEEQLFEELFQNPALVSLIDELYFEHHVNGSAMTLNGWQTDKSVFSAIDMDIADSYRWFSQLRQLGIRAHSWV